MLEFKAFFINFWTRKTEDHYNPPNLPEFDHFGHFDNIRVIFANARSSLNFCVSYVARTFASIQSVSRLFCSVPKGWRKEDPIGPTI